MAYIVSTTQTATAAAATYTVTLGAHQSGDLLLIKLSQDGGGTAIAPDATATTAGWAMIGTQAASSASRSAWAFLIADSASEVNPTFTGANDDWIGTCLVIRDAHATAPFGSLVQGTDWQRTDWDAVNSSNSGALTTAVDGCLLLYSWNIDGSNQYLRCRLNDATAVDKYAVAGVNHIIAARQQQTAAAAPTVTVYSPVNNDGGNGWVLAVRNKASGVLQPDVRPSITELKWYGSWATQHDGVTWEAPNAFAASINSITCSSTAPTVANTASSAVTPWGLATSLNNSESTAGAWVGGTHAIASTNMTGKVFAVQWERQQFSGSALQGADGVVVGFSDGTNWAAYQVASRAKGWAANEQFGGFIAVGNATAYASSGSINWAAVTRIGYFVHKIGSTATALGLVVKNAALFGTTALTGGGSARPALYQDYVSAMNSWGVFEWAKLNASSQITAKSSLQIGDGTNVTYFDGAAASLEYPQAWSASQVDNWQMGWNALAGSVALSVKASASDTINLASGVAATDTQQAFTIDAASSTSATYNFAQSFVGWTPTLKTGIAVSGATFKECGEIAGAGANLTNCTIAKTTSTDAAHSVTANGATLSSVTIDVTGTSAAYHLELGASVTAVTLANVTFSGTPGTDKVHVLATTGTVTITISGTTSLAAGDVTSAGATVVISAPQLYQTVTVTGSRVGSRWQIYDCDYNFTVTGVSVYPAVGETYTDARGVIFTVISSGGGNVHTYAVTAPPASGTLTKTSAGTGDASITFTACSDDGTELFNGTATGGNGVVTGGSVVWTDPIAASAKRHIRLRRAYTTAATADEFLEAIIGICGILEGTESISYLDASSSDSVYVTNAIDGTAVADITFTDSATDLVNINKAGGSTTWPTIYAAWVYHAFTATGIAKDIDYIEAIDPANYLLTGMKVKNTSSPSVPLTITGGFGRDAMTGSIVDIIDTTGGNIYPLVDHVVAYATGSALTAGQDATLSAIKSSTDAYLDATVSSRATNAGVLSAATATPIAANIKQVNSLAVDGAGTESDPWGPA